MNIFEIHRHTTQRIEPFHSSYLIACFRDSPELLGGFWALATDGVDGWKNHGEIEVIGEDTLEGNKRIDIVLKDSTFRRLIAIEAKTSDKSVEQGQLDDYLVRLKKKYPDYSIWMAYLTPFNNDNKPLGLLGHKGINEFRHFRLKHIDIYSSHLSWLQLTSLAPVVHDDVWYQHSNFVTETICKPPPVTITWGSLQDDLGWEIMRDFWDDIIKAGFNVNNGDIMLKQTDNCDVLSDAFRILMNSDQVNSHKKMTRLFPIELRSPFLNSIYAKFHTHIFSLLDEYPFLGIEGRAGYGIHLPLHGRHSDVSICTAKPNRPGLLIIGRKPK